MRKSLLLILCLVFTAADLHGFVNGRYQWWKTRMKALQEERQRLQGDAGVDPSIISLVNTGTERAREMCAIYERERNSDGSLQHEIKPLSPEEVREEVSRTASPVFAVYCLERLVNAPAEIATVTVVEKTAEGLMRRAVASGFGASDEALQSALMKDEITGSRRQDLALESVFEGIAEGRARMQARFLDLVEKGISAEPATLAEHRRRIVQASASAARGAFAAQGAFPPEAAVNATWTMQRLLHGVEKELAGYKRIQAMGGEPENLPQPALLYRLSRDPMELDRVIFENLATAHFRGKDPGNSPGPTGPRDMDSAATFREMDRLRRSVVNTLTGREGPEFFAALEKRFAALTEKHGAGIQKRHSREEGAPAENERDSRKTGALLSGETELIRRYGTASVDFVRLCSDRKKMDGGRVVTSYRDRTAKNIEYIELIRSLVSDGAAIAEVEAPAEQKAYALLVRRTKDLLPAIARGQEIERQWLPFLSASQLAEVKNARSRFLDALLSARAGIAADYASSVRRGNDSAKRHSASREGLQATIAKHELEIIAKNIQDFASLYDSLNYAGAAFSRYAGTYEKLERGLAEGAVFATVESSIKMKSLIPAIGDFDGARINREYATKQYLKKEIRAETSRLVTLARLHRQKGTAMDAFPGEERLEAVQSRLAQTPSAPVAGWRMTELNFGEVDRKAAFRLLHMRDRLLWAPAREGRPDPKTARPASELTLDGLNISLTIPGGWTMREADSRDGRKGAIKVFTSADNRASISIVRVPMEGKTAQEAGALWVKSYGAAVVKQRWGRKEGFDYFWTLARGPDKTVTETYAIPLGAEAVLISGVAPGRLYAPFKITMDSVFASVR